MTSPLVSAADSGFESPDSLKDENYSLKSRINKRIEDGESSEELTSASFSSIGSRNEAPTAFKVKPGRTDLGEKDYRHPLYLSAWEKGIRTGPDGGSMAQDHLDEPHIKRKLEIQSRYPQVKELFGYEPLTKWIALAAVVAQLAFSYLWGRILPEYTWSMLLAAYVIGGSIAQVYAVIIHEITHDLTAKTPFANRMVGLMLNIPIPFPISMSFRRYHLEHHTYQGVEGKDPDMPLPWEVKLVRNGGPITKTLWLFTYPAMYVIRGAVQKKLVTPWEWVNLVFTICCVISIWIINGPMGFAYLFASLWLGYGVHPAAAHFIQEHYTFQDGQETFSYYGSGNWFYLNLGYHNEHHDFARIPWSRLPDLHNMAPEYYKTLAYHTSWFKVLKDFIFNPTLGPQSRVYRNIQDHNVGRSMIRRS